MSGKAVIYCRVSTKEQISSLSTQEFVCQEWCKKNNIEVVGVFKDVCSGLEPLEKRPGFKQLLELLNSRNDIEYIVVSHLDRLARDTEIIRNAMKLLKEKKIKLILAGDKLVLDPEELLTRTPPVGLCKQCLAKVAYRVFWLYKPYIMRISKTDSLDFTCVKLTTTLIELFIPELRDYIIEKVKRYFPDIKVEPHEGLVKVFSQLIDKVAKSNDVKVLELISKVVREIELDAESSTQ